MSIKIQSCRTLNGLVNRLDEYAKNDKLIFRGHRRRSYRLQTTLYREFGFIHNESWNTFIDDKLYDFRSRLAQIGIIPFESHEVRDWLEYARHQGLPTPYIDFTLSPYVALFFAISGADPLIQYNTAEKYAVICMVNSNSLFHAWARTVGITDMSAFHKFMHEEASFFEPVLSGDSFCPTDTMKLFNIPSVFNRRMLEQRAVLLYDTVDYRRHGYLDLEDLLEKQPDMNNMPNLTKLLVPKKLARDIYEELERRGVSGCTLFQSAEGIIQDLINEYNYCRVTPSPRIPLGMDYWRRPMDLEKYRIQTGDSYLRFYDMFLQNTLKGRKYEITMVDGSTVTGIPTAETLIDRRNPHFTLSIDGDKYGIPFRDIVNAVEQ